MIITAIANRGVRAASATMLLLSACLRPATGQETLLPVDPHAQYCTVADGRGNTIYVKKADNDSHPISLSAIDAEGVFVPESQVTDKIGMTKDQIVKAAKASCPDFR